MGSFIAIVKASNGKVDKFEEFDTKAEADEHVLKFGGFVALHPGGGIAYWNVNEVAETVLYDETKSDSDRYIRDVMATIRELELQKTKRLMTDAILDIINPVDGKPGKVKLREIEDLLDIERAKL